MHDVTVDALVGAVEWNNGRTWGSYRSSDEYSHFYSVAQ